ncbi:MAG TPA: outer membrane lipid asymmetry maintenance protein MlaD [Burkholderiales bacterium]|jgi:phospholipid/cholesterol/gamma-HCH transport system substrate-binding protein|nr:outer membrane lipid asymmetry maintenance protein MlaD [Burkholderiales bacterium]
MERTFMDFWVGVFVLGGIAALMILALKVGNASTYNLSDSYKLVAEFDNIGGLRIRAPVKSAGVVVGRVDDIQFDTERFVARVTFTVDGRYQFPKDTFASVLTSGLLGEQYIGLSPGGDNVMLKSGEVVTQTQSAVVLEELISKFLFDKAAEGAPAK